MQISQNNSSSVFPDIQEREASYKGRVRGSRSVAVDGGGCLRRHTLRRHKVQLIMTNTPVSRRSQGKEDWGGCRESFERNDGEGGRSGGKRQGGG